MSFNVHETAVVGLSAQWRKYRQPNVTEWDERWMRVEYQPQIHPTAVVGPLCVVDAGCVRPTKIGANTQIMAQVHVGHGVQIGEDCDVASGTVIAGEVTIGDRVRVGVGALFKPFVTVGDDARVGAGAVVIYDVPAGVVVAGNPARVLPAHTRPAEDQALDALREANS